MKLLRSLFISSFFIAVVIQPTQAKQVTEIQSVQELDRSARTVKDLLAQIEQQNSPAQNQGGEVIQVTSVQGKPHLFRCGGDFTDIFWATVANSESQCWQ